MKFTPLDPPRVFPVGLGKKIDISDCGRMKLEADEQITFVTESGAEYDVARKSWGFYATPSINGRLKSFNLRGVFVRAKDGKFYVFIVEKGKEDDFHDYLEVEGHRIVSWLDDDGKLERLSRYIESD